MSPQERRAAIAAAADARGAVRYTRSADPGRFLERREGKSLDLQYPQSGYWTDAELAALAREARR